MLDPTLLLTLLVVLASALFGAYLNGKRKDRCLLHFEGGLVHVEMLGGRRVFGRLHVEPTGLELIYETDQVDEQHHIETSYLLYKDELPNIQAVYRYCDQLSDNERSERQAIIQRVFHPRPLKRLHRRARNFIALASDSLSQAIGVVLGSSKARGSSFITDESQEYFTGLGANLIGYAGTEYDPLLERYVGVKVVVELREGDTVYEHVGILRDYTADFLELLEIHYPQVKKKPLAAPHAAVETPFIRIQRNGRLLHVSNPTREGLLIESVIAAEKETPVNAVLDPGEDLTWELAEDLAGTDVEATLKIVRPLDLIIPRARALIRHKAERYDPDQVFDIGFGLRPTQLPEERKLRETLDANPDDATSAVALGQILFRRGRLNEAERWFDYALERRERLADQGKLAARQLRYVQLKHSEFDDGREERK